MAYHYFLEVTRGDIIRTLDLEPKGHAQWFDKVPKLVSHDKKLVVVKKEIASFEFR